MSNLIEPMGPEEVVAYVYDVRPWRDMNDDERAEWVRRVIYVRENIPDFNGEKWTNERLANLFGLSLGGLKGRLDSVSAAQRGHEPAAAQDWTKRQARIAAKQLREPEVIDDLAQDPEVVDALASNPALIQAVSQRVQENHRQQSDAKRASDPVGRKMDEKIALLDLQKAINRFVREANDLLPHIGPVPADERYWLTGEADRLENVTREVRYLADNGETRTDAELRALTGGV